MKIAEAGKVSIQQQVALSRHWPPEPNPSRIPAGPPLDPQHPLTPAASPLPQSQMSLQYIDLLFLEHDLSLATLAMETLAQQKRDYYQVRGALMHHFSTSIRGGIITISTIC